MKATKQKECVSGGWDKKTHDQLFKSPDDSGRCPRFKLDMQGYSLDRYQ